MREKRAFTLIESVMVILIVAILALVVNARVGFLSGWEEAGASESLTAYINAAQKLAISNRRTVYLNISASQISACYDAACLAPCSNLDGTALTLAAPSGSFSASSSSFSFDSIGRPSFASAFSITYGTKTVTIEPETGLIW